MLFTGFFGQEVKSPISHLSVTLSSLKLGEFPLRDLARFS